MADEKISTTLLFKIFSTKIAEIGDQNINPYVRKVLKTASKSELCEF
jgi:hypothetical protein